MSQKNLVTIPDLPTTTTTTPRAFDSPSAHRLIIIPSKGVNPAILARLGFHSPLFIDVNLLTTWLLEIKSSPV